MAKLADVVQRKAIREGENQDLLIAKSDLARFDTKRLNCDVSADVYKKFQLKVIQDDTSITSVVNQMIMDYVSSV